jgi:YesN/AraC family two-component response regulator
MLRPAIFALSLLFFSSPALAQTAPTESPTLQAVLAEIRQLRQDLQTSAIAARRAQILIYRLHVQEAAAARASQRLDEAKSSIEQFRARRKYQELEIKRYEDMRDRAENASQRQQFVDAITELKAQMEVLAPEEQEAQMRETELEQQSRIEQAKLGQLQDELDRLDQAVMNAALHAASAHP